MPDFHQEVINLLNKFSKDRSKIRLLRLIGSELFSDLSINLPLNLNDTFERYTNSIEELTKGKFDEFRTSIKSSIHIFGPLGDLLDHEMLVKKKQLSLKDLSENVDFSLILIQQELVFLISLFSGFLDDIVRLLCKNVPNYLKKGKQMTYEEIISSEDWDSLIESMSNRVVFDEHEKSLEKRVEVFLKWLTIDIDDFYEEILLKFNETRQIRNCIVHKSGLVTKEILKISTRTGLKLNDIYPLDDKFMIDLYSILDILATLIASGIIKKFT